MTDHPVWLLHRYDSVGSTMEVASQLARFGARERTVVVSTEQTSGRGRGGRSWHAARGSAVFATLIVRPPVAASRLSTLPLMAGLAVAEAIERVGGCGASLKWPNDVWLGVDHDFGKVAGVLVTTSLRGERVAHALIGVGINVLGSPRNLPLGATTIEAATGVTTKPDAVLDEVLDRFDEAYAAFVAAAGRPPLEAWLARAALLGEVVTVEDGGRLRTGTYVGIAEDGGLLIHEPGHPVHKVVAGDLVRGPRTPARSG